MEYSVYGMLKQWFTALVPSDVLDFTCQNGRAYVGWVFEDLKSETSGGPEVENHFSREHNP